MFEDKRKEKEEIKNQTEKAQAKILKEGKEKKLRIWTTFLLIFNISGQMFCSEFMWYSYLF